MANPLAVCWLNGRILPAGEATVSVFDHGLLYGDGVFEGVRFYSGQPFRLEEHLLRLERSARAIALTLPLGLAELGAAVRETIEAAGFADGYIRLVVTRGAGSMGLDPRHCTRPNVFIIADGLTLFPEDKRVHGIRAMIAATRRLPADGLDPRIKSLNYLNHILARIEANRAGCEEAILLNARGMVAEGTADNVFIVLDGTLYTPPPSDGALEGITRAVIIELACRLGIPVRERSLAPYDLYTAEECFLTGTGAELVPVREIDGRRLTLCPGPVFERILSAFREQIRAETEPHPDDQLRVPDVS